MTDLISYRDALGLVLARAQPLPAEDVQPPALGRVLAESAVAAVDLPPFPSSAMDGFAVRPADTPGRLGVVGESIAGRPWLGELGPGEAIAISTGAVVPARSAVVPVEEARLEGGFVELPRAAEGAHVRLPGGDIGAGETVLPAGAELGFAQLGALAAAGVTRVRCARRPRVAVLATGSELRAPGEPLEPGQIYESNSTLLGARLARLAEVTIVQPVPDEREAIEAALALGLDADVLITSGGVSMGEHDLVRPALATLGVEELFWRIALRPGKPVSFGVRERTLVFGLPGNPVSSLVGCELLVAPALRALQGAVEPGPRFLPGRLGRAHRRTANRDELARAVIRIDGDSVVLEPLARQDSHMIVRSASADALVLIERGDGEAAAGELVRYLPL